MLSLPICLSLACLLFCIGLLIVLIRKELLFVLMGIEVMFNAAVLAAVSGSAYWQNATGDLLALFMMVIAGAELAVSLIIVLLCYRHLKITTTDQLQHLNDELSTEAL